VKEGTCETTTSTGEPSAGWIRLLRENNRETGDFLEVAYRTSYTPENGMVVDEVLVRDPKKPEHTRRFTAEQWKAVEFPLDLGEEHDLP
jgi:hypothetical protein